MDGGASLLCVTAKRLCMNLRGSTFLITGGSSGLGAACARRFVGQSARIVLADLNQEAGEKLASELGQQARFIHTDVTSAESVEQAIAGGVAAFDKLDGVIHCAGILGAARVLGKDGPHDLALFRRIIEVNLVGTFNVVRLAAAAIAKNEANADGERGVIVLTSSVAALEGQIGQAAYAASKGGVAALTLPVARELARFGIRVVSIAPGVFETPMMEGLSATAQQELAAQVPFPPRLGRPDEFAALSQQIVENPMLNGAVIRLDGALRMAPK